MSVAKNLRSSSGVVERVLEPRVYERFKGFKLRRVLSNAPAVGPFVLFDHFGPVTFGVGQGLDGGPHPHVGMATLTYLFEGRVLHRDSIGSAAVVAPGGANWMVCGRGVAHSERTPQEDRRQESRLAGAQLWLALPAAHEEDAPRFEHHTVLPVIEGEGKRLRVVAGSFAGTRSPVGTLSGTLCVDAELAAGAVLALSAGEHRERAAYVVAGEIDLGGESYGPERIVIFGPGKEIVIEARSSARLLLLGGEPLGRRHMWSTVVSSRADRIAQAKADWDETRIPSVVGEVERGAFPKFD